LDNKQKTREEKETYDDDDSLLGVVIAMEIIFFLPGGIQTGNIDHHRLLSGSNYLLINGNDIYNKCTVSNSTVQTILVYN
jgi:hypothetical protein